MNANGPELNAPLSRMRVHHNPAPLRPIRVLCGSSRSFALPSFAAVARSMCESRSREPAPLFTPPGSPPKDSPPAQSFP